MEPEMGCRSEFDQDATTREPKSRTSNPLSGRLPSLDGLRALSVMVVIMCHATDERVGPAVRAFFPYFNGQAAVRVFFVISGFLITTLLVQEREKTGHISLAGFYQRRFIRLFPVQMCYILFLFILTLITPLQISACRFATAMFYLKNYACAGEIEGHLWSLSVEEQFYLLWPMVLVLVPRRWCYVVALFLIFVSPLSRIYQYKYQFPGSSNNAWFWLTSNSDIIMIGCVSALMYRKPWIRSIINWRPTLGRVCAVGMLIVPPILTNYLLLGFLTVTIGPTVQALGAAYIILSCVLVERGVLYQILNFKPLVFIGLMSYSLYVWQQIFFFVAPGDLGLRDSFIFHFPVDVLAAVGAGCLSYFAIEMPLAGVRKAMAERAYRTVSPATSLPAGIADGPALRIGSS